MEADAEAKAEADAIAASKAAAVARREAVIAKSQPGDEKPTADVEKATEAAAVKQEAESANPPKKPKTVMEVKVAKKQKELADTDTAVVDAKK